MNKLTLSIAMALCFVCTACSTLTDSGNGTVTDSVNKLVIQRCPIGQTWDENKCNGDSQRMKWWDAMKAAKNTSDLGQNDWRLPSEEEVMVSMKQSGLCDDNKRIIKYWTSTKFNDSSNVRVRGDTSCSHLVSDIGNRSVFREMLALDEKNESEVMLVRGGKSSAISDFNNAYKEAMQSQVAFNATEEKQRKENFLELTNQTSLSKEKIVFSYVRSEENGEVVLDIKYSGNEISVVTLYVPAGYVPCNPQIRCRLTNAYMNLKGSNTYTATPFPLITPDNPSNVMSIQKVDLFSEFWRRSDKFLLVFYNQYGESFNATFYKRKMINKYEDFVRPHKGKKDRKSTAN